jgi:hypothetical protein
MVKDIGIVFDIISNKQGNEEEKRTKKDKEEK